MFQRLLLLLLFCSLVIHGNAQVVTECPQNIGFETGLLTNWQCAVGTISETGNNNNSPVRPAFITLNNSDPQLDQHTIIKRSEEKDYYGQFSTNAPNGSDYVIKLGNECTKRGAERISYTLKVPANVNAYSINFNYAVVFESPPHESDEQPKFTVRVVDVSGDTPYACGSYEFVASGGLSGFKVSSNQSRNYCDDRGGMNSSSPVLYKDWSPVLLNLSDYLGKTIRIEFTTNDCSRGGHFGYAYIDFDENCSIPLTGNISCNEINSITLKTIPGFFGYRWYNVENSLTYGKGDQVILQPVPPPGTKIAVELIPFPGLGCVQTLYTTIGGIVMNIKDPPPNCTSVDLTSISLKVGNSSDLTYTYWTDNQAINALADPEHVLVSGTYYIKGLSSSGCTLIKSIQVTISPLPPKIIFNRALEAEYPSTVDVTTAFVHENGIQYSYWLNKAATLPLSNPSRIAKKGNYYLKSTSNAGCIAITPFSVEIAIPDYVIPNAFSPNNDGVNDYLTVLINSKVQLKHFKIFSRWGQIVFITSDTNTYWNGNRNNTAMPVGVYYWTIEGILDSKRYLRSGSVTLLR